MGKMVSKDGASARKSPSRSLGNDGGRVSWKGYLSPDITAAEKQLYHEWRADPNECEKALKGALDAGFKISVDFQSKQRAYRAGLYCQAADRKEAGYCLTAFAGDWWEAVNRVVFLHAAVGGGSWNSFFTEGGWKDSWV